MSKIIVLLLLAFTTSLSFAQEVSYDKEMQKGDQALNTQNYATAIRHFQAAIAINPESSEAYLKQMMCAIMRRDLSTFKRSIIKLEELDQALILDIYITYAQIAKRKRLFEDALQMLAKAEKKYPQNREITLEKVDIYDKMHNTSQKVMLLNQLLSKNSNDIDAMYHLATTYFYSKPAESITLFKKLINANKYTDVALVSLGKLYLAAYKKSKQKKDLQLAHNYYKLYANRNPKNQEIKLIIQQLRTQLNEK